MAPCTVLDYRRSVRRFARSSPMYRGETVGVVVPAYNESGFVGAVIETVPSYVDRVYVIDDASTDDTWEEITTTAAAENDRRGPPEGDGDLPFEKRIVPIRHERNRGVGGAIKTGYLRALTDGIDVTAVMGGDGQMDPSFLPALLDPVVEDVAGYAKGNRLLDSGTYREMPRHRLVGNYVLSSLTRVASGYWGVGDPQNGYTVISRAALEAIPVEEMYEGYGYCNDLLVTLGAAGVRVADVPHEATYGAEESHISLRTYVPRVSAMLLRNFCWRLRRQYLHDRLRPAGFGYLSGLATGLLGVGIGLREVLDDDRRTRAAGNLARLLLGAFGVFLFGAALERIAGTDQSVRVAADATGRSEAGPDSTPPREPEVVQAGQAREGGTVVGDREQ